MQLGRSEIWQLALEYINLTAMENLDGDLKDKIYDHNSLKFILDAQKNVSLDRTVEDVQFLHL